jgi:hypothetical protein
MAKLGQKIVYLVRITKCSSNWYWYHDKIGQEFRCTKHVNTSLFWPTEDIFKTLALISDGSYSTHGNILPDDCEVLKEDTELFDYNQNLN